MSTFAPGSAHLTCRALVIDHEGRFLRVRAPSELPGARAEAVDHTLLETALRAATERTGLARGDLCLTPELLTTPAHVETIAPGHYEFTFALYLTHDLPEPFEGTDWLPVEQLKAGSLQARLSALKLNGEPAPVNASAPVIPRPAKAPDAGGTELNIVGVHLYAEDDGGRVLLGLRHPDSAFAGGTWHFLAGHCERESAVACLVREAYEEAGLVIDAADLELAHVVHVLHGPSARPRMQLVFRARRLGGTPWLREPDKCLAWRWWDPDVLPEPLVPYARTAIDGIRAGRTYSEMGWCPA
ncbi:NUDIX hydrolase [Streptomyces bauhiniae]|nr:NUDIX domain-containing protein [Streptomyces bauhiniae]